jgi:hypothetical protein
MAKLNEYDQDEDDDLAGLLQEIDDEDMMKCTDNPQCSNGTQMKIDALTFAHFNVSTTNDEQKLVNPSDSSFSICDSPSFNRVLGDCGVLPMIDISTPQIFSQRPQSKSFILSSPQSQKQKSSALATSVVTKLPSSGHIVMIPESFNLEDLKHNITHISSTLHLSPVEAIKMSSARRVTFPLALMVRDFRQIGSMAQVRFIDGQADEIIGSLPFSACTELGFKLHFGLLLILNEVWQEHPNSFSFSRFPSFPQFPV